VMPSNLLMVQNAAERRDVGIATGSLLFLRAMGSAVGSTLVGTLLASRFAAGLAAQGVTIPIDLGALRGAGARLALDPAVQAAARVALADGFRATFLACAGMTALGFLACLALRDLPLKSAHAVALAATEPIDRA